VILDAVGRVYWPFTQLETCGISAISFR
jgi:hypothetical protein